MWYRGAHKLLKVRKRDTYNQIFVLPLPTLAQHFVLVPVQGFITHVGWRNIILVPEAVLKLGIFIGCALPLADDPIVAHTAGFLVAEDAMVMRLPLPLYWRLNLFAYHYEENLFAKQYWHHRVAYSRYRCQSTLGTSPPWHRR